MPNTNSGYKLFISSTPQRKDRTLEQFEAMTWVQVNGIGSHGETGTSTNILTYDTWSDDVTRKSKGLSNAGDPVVEVARRAGDAGQTVLREAAEDRFNWGFKIEGGGRLRYNLGMVAGPMEPNGRNEDFDLETYTLALQQTEISRSTLLPLGWLGLSGAPLGLGGLTIGVTA